MLAGAFMLNVFTLANGRLFQEEIESDHALAEVQPVWVDLDAPTEAEKGWIAEHFGLTIPSDAVDDDLEESARFYEEDNGELHIRSDFLIDDGETARNVRVAFILHRNILFSVHAEDAAGVSPVAPARAPHPGADRGRQGRAAQALRRRRRVLGRRARRHLRQPRGGERARAAPGRRTTRRPARRSRRSPARRT